MSAVTRSIPARAFVIRAPIPASPKKRSYLADLGITAVELLPVDEFDENDCQFVNPMTGEKLRNFWGYNPIVFCAPKAAYANNPERHAPWHEFCEMVDRVPRSGNRGHSRRRFQPHGRGRRRRPNASTFAASTTPSTTCSTKRAAI